MRESEACEWASAAPRMVAVGDRSCRALIERCYDEGWTDGLPVVPPDEAAVRTFLDECRWDPDEVVLFEPVRGVAVYAPRAPIMA